MGQITATVLCIDDEREMLNAYRRTLRSFVSTVLLATTADEGLALLRSNAVDIVILDLRMPGRNGLEALPEITDTPNAPAVIIATGHGSVVDAVEAMKLGAADFIEKPFTPARLYERIEPLLHRQRAGSTDATVPTRSVADDLFPEIIGVSGKIRDLKRTVAKLASTNVTVTILGESGTGKELIARALHEGSARRDRPYIVVDCGSLPETMIESELFGYRKGAFTGAHESAPGLFRSADGGTIFLDEIAELPLPMQTRLLRSVQNREIRPVGSHQPIKIDVRIIAATNRNLRDAVAAGTFREDLYFRLTAVVLNAPPLRERPEDVAPLAEHFLRQFSRGISFHLQPAAVRRLEQHTWPGNVRELENVIHRAIALSHDGIIRAEDLKLEDAEIEPAAQQEARRTEVVQGEATGPPGEVSAPAPPEHRIPPDRRDPTTLVNAKDAAIDSALEQTGGNRRQAARILGVAESTIYRNLKRRGLL
ncbi:MAG: sigma-54-dependent transcriptional regulator [Alkalispirochaeta sp.]